ncbi:lmo0937 family membrane protein [Fluviicola sp. SGL-29]|nr:lmo0937 family membrane protein [Fluviicola sp. SGL-29]
MGSTIYTIAITLIILWGVAYFGFKYEGGIHTVLAVALFMVIFQLIRGRSTKKSSDT